jgi:predicted Zn-dependent protease
VQPVEEVPVFRPQREDAEQVEETVVPPTTPQSEALPQNAAVVALLDGAQVDTRSGDLRAAQNRLERALRIAPRDPQVYYQLADVQRRMGQFLQAEQVALKGVDVATGQAAALRRLWSLLALIRSDAGNPEGAKAAQREASRY